MAAGDMVQKGTVVTVAFGGNTHASLIMEAVDVSPAAEIKPIKGENNATVTKLISDPGKKMTLEGTIIAAGVAALVAFKKGDAVTINTVSWMIEDISIKYSKEEAKCSLTVVKEDSMTYT